jgi:hypothetical protein
MKIEGGYGGLEVVMEVSYGGDCGGRRSYGGDCGGCRLVRDEDGGG